MGQQLNSTCTSPTTGFHSPLFITMCVGRGVTFASTSEKNPAASVCHLCLGVAVQVDPFAKAHFETSLFFHFIGFKKG
jgi:hypothetical protein